MLNGKIQSLIQKMSLGKPSTPAEAGKNDHAKLERGEYRWLCLDGDGRWIGSDGDGHGDMNVLVSLEGKGYITIHDIDIAPWADTAWLDVPDWLLEQAIEEGGGCNPHVDVSIDERQRKIIPGVKKIIIGAAVRWFGLNDTLYPSGMFPNAKEVESHSKWYRSGAGVIAMYPGYDETHLLHAFPQGREKVIDLSGITTVRKHAFDGIEKAKIINTNDVQNFWIEAKNLNDNLIKMHTREDGAVVFGSIYVKAPKDAGKVNLTSGITCIASDAFDGLSGTPKINIDKDAKINWENLQGCLGGRQSQLSRTGIEIGGTTEDYKSIDGLIYTYDGTGLLYCPYRKGKIKVADGTKRIAKEAFGCVRASEIEFPDSLEEIGEYAIYSTENEMERLKIPKSVKKLEEGSLSGDINRIETESDEPIPGLMNALGIRTRPDTYNPYSDASHYIDMDIGGKKFIVPKITKEEALEAFKEHWDAGVLDMEEAASLCMEIPDGINDDIRFECCLAQFRITQENEKLKEYVLNTAERMATKYLKDNDTKRFVEIIEAGVIKPGTLEKFCQTAADSGKTGETAYILEAIEKAKRNAENSTENLSL